MTFLWPTMLWFLLLIPLAVLLYFRLQQRRRKLSALYGSLGWAPNTAKKGPGIRRHIPPMLFLAGLVILITSLARPQATVELPRIEGTVILAFDVSGSMAANDLEPTRMQAAKAAAQAFVESQPSTVKIGVVAFSDSGFSVVAPTYDQNEIMVAINRLTPQRGTALAHGILTSINTIDIDAGRSPSISLDADPMSPDAPQPSPVPEGSYASAAIVLLSDGENNIEPDPLAAAQLASDKGVRIYTVGIGSAAGVNLEVNGFTVYTRLDEATLQQIAQISGGEYYNAQTQQDLLSIYNNLSPQLMVKPEKMEITSIFAGASILALLTGGLFSFLWFNRLP